MAKNLLLLLSRVKAVCLLNVTVSPQGALLWAAEILRSKGTTLQEGASQWKGSQLELLLSERPQSLFQAWGQEGSVTFQA